MALKPFRTCIPETEDGLVFYLTLNEGVGAPFDLVKGKRGSVSGAIFYEGKYGNSIDCYPGTVDFNNLNFNLTNGVTISMWLRLVYSFSVSTYTVFNSEGYYSLTFTLSSVSYRMSNTTEQSFSGSYFTGNWFHVAIVGKLDGTVKSACYINGNRVYGWVDEGVTSFYNPSTLSLKIGFIDDLKIYNRALSDREIWLLSKGAVIKPRTV